ncbi:MAG: HEAT repeat domain-containing protein [Myxococcales bacterium]|nr:HEAT repeat domain-containing protein [Myxococcales bacterium]
MITCLTALLVLAAPPAGDSSPTHAQLIDALPACESMEDCAATRALLKRGDAAIADLTLALARPEELVRFWALGLLGELKAKSAFDAVTERAAKDQSVRVRAAALYTLGQLADRRATPTLTSALSDPDLNLRIAATLAMGLLLDPATISPLRRALADKDDEVRAYAAAALGELGAKDAIPELLLRLDEDIKPMVRALVADALGRLHAESAVPSLARCARSDGVIDVRVECAKGLAAIPGPAATAALDAAHDLPDPVAPIIREALAARRPPAAP